MNLSNKDLHYALWCAEKHTGNSLYTEAMADLEEAILEIEGYIREDSFCRRQQNWTKFDPGNPDTFPPCNYEWFLFAAQKPLEPPTFTVLPELATDALLERIRNDIIKFKLNVYWRPLPKPPQEEIK